MSKQYLTETVEMMMKIIIESMQEAGVTDDQLVEINNISIRKFEEAMDTLKAGL
jgi:hypothetical protein